MGEISTKSASCSSAILKACAIGYTADSISSPTMRTSLARICSLIRCCPFKLAEEHEADLVEISPNAVPPVCRIIDYSKFLYQLKKRQKEQKAKQVKVNVKEIRFGPQTDDHDYNFKLKHAIGFLQDGDKVKAYVFFKGRSILFKEQGEVLLLRFANDLEEYAKVEQMPILEGKRMTISLAPKKAAAPKKEKPAAPKKAEESAE